MLAAKISNLLNLHFGPFWSNVTYSPDSPVNVLIESRIFEFLVLRFLKNHENSVFCSRIVPTTSELNLTGSIYHSSAVTMSNTNLALFLRFKKYRYLKNRDLWGDQNIAILTQKTGLLSVFFTEKRYRSINIGYITNIISNTIPLRVCLLSELRCLTRIFAVR